MSNKMDKYIMIKVTKEEKDLIMQYAKDKSLNLSALVRQLLRVALRLDASAKK